MAPAGKLYWGFSLLTREGKISRPPSARLIARRRMTGIKTVLLCNTLQVDFLFTAADCHRNGFGGRGVGLVAKTGHRHQRVGFRVVGRQITAWNIVTDQFEASNFTLHAVGP